MSIDRLLLTRPRAQSERFARLCGQTLGAGIRITISPVLEITPLAVPLDLAGVKGLIFTSENGVRIFAARSPERRLPVWCVGSRTAEVARALGFAASEGPGDAAALIAHLADVQPEGPLLHLHGAHVTGDLAARLSGLGLPVRGLAIYDQTEQPLSDPALALLADPRPVLVPVFSPRTALLLNPALGKARAILHIAAISPAVVKCLQVQSDTRIEVAAHPDGTSMLAALSRLNRNGSVLER